MMEDPRELTEWQKNFWKGSKLTCRYCKATNWSALTVCHSCGKSITKFRKSGLTIAYKYGRHILGEKRNRDNEAFIQKNQADLLQPYTYDKATKDWVKNKDFVKVYGDPEKQRFSPGEAVEGAINSGEITLNGDDIGDNNDG